MTRPALSAMAAELAAEIASKDVVVATSIGEHHSDGRVTVFYSLDVYTREPWTAVVQFSECGPVGDDTPALCIIEKARAWLDVGCSLRYLGTPICTRCDDDGRFRLATKRHCQDWYCESCLDAMAEAQWEAACEGYYGDSSPQTFAERAEVARRDGAS